MKIHDFWRCIQLDVLVKFKISVKGAKIFKLNFTLKIFLSVLMILIFFPGKTILIFGGDKIVECGAK